MMWKLRLNEISGLVGDHAELISARSRIRVQVFFASTLNIYHKLMLLSYDVVNIDSFIIIFFFFFTTTRLLCINCYGPVLGHSKVFSNSNVVLNLSFPAVCLYKCTSSLIKWTWVLRQYAENFRAKTKLTKTHSQF